jgi:lipoprotein-anchoring transpeptidase ErfK/SrfK
VLKKNSVVLGAVAIALIAAAPARAAQKLENLNKPGKESYYAYVEQAVGAKSQPKTSAKTVGKLRLKTGEGTDDLVLVIARTTDSKDRVWLKVRLPIRPNGTTGWAQESALSELQPVDSWIKVSTKTNRLTVIKKGKKVFSAPVGVGQSQWPTPKGQFYIRAKLTNFGDAFYGPIAYVTSATSDTLTDWPGGGIVGIHGTSLPNLIPGKISHGCVRMKNADIKRVDKLVEVGTPITVT